MPLSLIVAMTRAGVIGRRGALPWRLSADLQRFKSLTMGHHILMGRKTFESLGRVLPGRTSVVITRQDYPLPAGAIVANDLEAALRFAAIDSEPFIIGGAEIYRLALPRVDRLYVTWVETDVAGDTCFPAVNWTEWRETATTRHPADDKNEYDTTHSIYNRAI